MDNELLDFDLNGLSTEEIDKRLEDEAIDESVDTMKTPEQFDDWKGYRIDDSYDMRDSFSSLTKLINYLQKIKVSSIQKGVDKLKAEYENHPNQKVTTDVVLNTKADGRTKVDISVNVYTEAGNKNTHYTTTHISFDLTDEDRLNELLYILENDRDYTRDNIDLEESIEKHDTLNPAIWNTDNTMKSEVRDKLLELTNYFLDNAKKDGVEFDVKDIVLVGSNANYNYTNDSDIDLHIIVSRKPECNKPEHLDIIYNYYKKIFNDKFDCTINNIPVELYLEFDDEDIQEQPDENINLEEAYNNLRQYIDKTGHCKLPGTFKEIKDGAFHYNQELKSIIVPNSVTKIGDRAFECCESLKDVKLSDNLTQIQSQAFHGCDALESIIIPNSVTHIGHSLFESCRNLKEVTLSNNIMEIFPDTFKSCVTLKTIEIPDSVIYIDFTAFSDCVDLENVKLSSNLRWIEDYAFSNCKSLESLTIPSSVTKIADTAFLRYNIKGLHPIKHLNVIFETESDIYNRLLTYYKEHDDSVSILLKRDLEKDSVDLEESCYSLNYDNFHWCLNKLLYKDYIMYENKVDGYMAIVPRNKLDDENAYKEISSQLATALIDNGNDSAASPENYEVFEDRFKTFGHVYDNIIIREFCIAKPDDIDLDEE